MTRKIVLTSLVITYIGWLLSMFDIAKLIIEKVPVQVNVFIIPFFFVFVTLISLVLLNIGKMIWIDK